jgi:hypothetical protein
VRTLAPAPSTIAFGSFRGALPRVTWDGSRLERTLRAKSWLWLGATTPEMWLSLAILRTGYAANILGYVFDRKAGRMIFEKTVVAPTPLASVTTDVHAPGLLARYTALTIERSGPDLTVRGLYGKLACDFTLDESTAPPGIVAAADLGGGRKNATEKRALMKLRGTIDVEGRRFDLEGGTGGWDYTNGLLPRHTKWRWAFGLGRDVAFNLVEGFVGEAECALFTPDDVQPLAEARFSFDSDRPSEPWILKGEGNDLRFEVGAVHAQNTNLVVVRSRFLQPVGTFYGTIGGRNVDGTPGVVEDQDVVW